MKVQKLDRKLDESEILEEANYPGDGMFLVQEKDNWWHLILIIEGVYRGRLMLSSAEERLPYEDFFLGEPANPAEVETPKAPSPLEFPPELRLFSFSQVLDLLRAARGTNDHRI